MKKLTFILIALFYFAGIHAQNGERCATMSSLEYQKSVDPMIEFKMQELERFVENFKTQQVQQRGAGVITIPVVFHLIYKTPRQRPSLNQVTETMNILNEDFRALNADLSNNWSQVADAEIEFCLATIDPDGNPTDGINVFKTSVGTFNPNTNDVKFDATGGQDAWPTDQYLNVWVCNLPDYPGGSYLAGYAQFPNGGAYETDGVVTDYNFFGTSGTAFSWQDGRTTTHEVGHWLHLYHIWGDIQGGGCGGDDLVSDTPLQETNTSGCPLSKVSCGSLDMVENFMDYANCTNMFTEGQKVRMQATLSPGGFRSSIASSGGCGSVGPTCTDGIQNGNETGVDCGGPDCPACPTCTDGIQNGNETGIDCGGPDCPACPPGSCDTPTNEQMNYSGRKKATISWNASTGAVSYEAQYRVSGTSNWTTKSATGTSVNATQMNLGTTYDYRVRAICSGSNSDYTAIGSYTHQSGNLILGNANDEIAVYPNPTNDYVKVEFLNELSIESRITIIDGMGRELATQSNLDNQRAILFNLSELSPGLYFIKVENNKEMIYLEKLLVF